MTNKEKQFLTLRANGSTFDAIAKELKVSKPTLVKWSKLYEDDINDLVALSLLALKEEYSYTQTKKYKTLLKHLDKVDKVINDKDLSKVGIKDLMAFKNDILDKLNIIDQETNFKNVGLEDIGIIEQMALGKKQLVNINNTII